MAISISLQRQRNESWNRNSPEKFKRYMKENPVYFEIAFECKATRDNIAMACKEVVIPEIRVKGDWGEKVEREEDFR